MQGGGRRRSGGSDKFFCPPTFLSVAVARYHQAKALTHILQKAFLLPGSATDVPKRSHFRSAFSVDEINAYGDLSPSSVVVSRSLRPLRGISFSFGALRRPAWNIICQIASLCHYLPIQNLLNISFTRSSPTSSPVIFPKLP